MRKLLFAPADPQISRALEKVLHTQQEKWEWYIASSAEEAQERLAETDLDAVVADFGWEIGRSIFTKARKSFPEIARIGVVAQSQLKFLTFRLFIRSFPIVLI